MKPSHELTVPGPELRSAASRLLKMMGRDGLSQAVLSFQDALVIRLPQASIAVTASGEWPGRVFAHARATLVFMGEATDDQVGLSVRDGWLYVGTNRIQCEVRGERTQPLPRPLREEPILPLNATVAEAVSLKFAYTKQQIEDAGLAASVARAEERYARAMLKAAEALAPLEVTMAELRECVERSIRRRYLPPIGGDSSEATT